MKRRAIVTVGINPQRRFGPYHERFERTLNPAAGLSCAHDMKRWEHEWPPGSPTHHEVHYAFKAHAVKDALARGFTSVLWLDVSCYAVASLEPLWQVIESQGYFLCGEPAIDPETGFVEPSHTMCGVDKLGCWSSDYSLRTFGVTRDQAMRIPLFSGTCFGLDFTFPRSHEFLNRLMSFAIGGHFNGSHISRLLLADPHAPREGQQVSTDPRVQGHRSDEVYMTLIAREMKMTSSGEHFTGGNAERPSTCLKSGYDIP